MNVSEQQSLTCATSAERIAQLNDKLRKTARGRQVVVTRGVTALPGFDAAVLMAALAAYDSFDEDNDPHGEHDFGDVDLWGAELSVEDRLLRRRADKRITRPGRRKRHC